MYTFCYLDDIEDEVEIELFLKEKQNKTYRKNFMVDEDWLVDYKKEIRILEY